MRFLPICEAARDAGLRACKKCHPDDYAHGADPVLETIETLVSEIRTDPANFSGARSIIRRSGFGSTRAFELFREHYHTTPADLLIRARLTHAKYALLGTKANITDVALAAGFESVSSFHDNFLQLNGLTPAVYRGLSSKSKFALKLPEGFLLPYLRRALSRDPHSVSERLVGDTYSTVVRF